MGYRNIKKQINLFLFFKLRIFIFQCPGTTHITNFTRMPHIWHYVTTCDRSRTEGDPAVHCFLPNVKRARASKRKKGRLDSDQMSLKTFYERQKSSLTQRSSSFIQKFTFKEERMQIIWLLYRLSNIWASLSHVYLFVPCVPICRLFSRNVIL